MGKDMKILIGSIVFTFVLIIGFAVWQAKKPQSQTTVNTAVLGVTATPEFYNLGNVAINGGLVTREYEVKNTSDKTLKLSRIATSCMCTTAKVKMGESESRFFGMEMSGDRNPQVSLEIKPGETGKVTVQFDPAAHGPTGVGPFDRIVWLYFTNGIKELKFNGVVVN